VTNCLSGSDTAPETMTQHLLPHFFLKKKKKKKIKKKKKKKNHSSFYLTTRPFIIIILTFPSTHKPISMSKKRAKAKKFLWIDHQISTSP
jgi:hypothetical protein